MPPLPVVSGRDAITAFEKDGWEVKRQKGSHISMTKPGMRAILTVPNHDELKAGTLRALIRTAELSVDEFNKLLDK